MDASGSWAPTVEKDPKPQCDLRAVPYFLQLVTSQAPERVSEVKQAQKGFLNGDQHRVLEGGRASLSPHK